MCPKPHSFYTTQTNKSPSSPFTLDVSQTTHHIDYTGQIKPLLNVCHCGSVPNHSAYSWYTVGHISTTSHIFNQYQSNKDVSQTTKPVHNIGYINPITNISVHFRSVPNHTPNSLYTLGHINTIANIVPLSVQCGCFQNYTPYTPFVGQINTLINVSVHCGSVPNHTVYSLYAVSYRNTITDFTVHLRDVPSHSVLTVYSRSHKQYHKHLTIISQLWTPYEIYKPNKHHQMLYHHQTTFIIALLKNSALVKWIWSSMGQSLSKLRSLGCHCSVVNKTGVLR